MERLDRLDRLIDRELAKPVARQGPVQAFALDLLREQAELFGRVVETAAGPRALRSALGRLVAAGPVDELGMDREFRARAAEVIRPFSRYWLGIESNALDTLDVDALSNDGALFAFNRSAAPWSLEALVLVTLLTERFGASRPVYGLWEPGLFEQPYVGVSLEKFGIFSARPENLQRLLERGAAVVVFPEGKLARNKSYDRRYRVEEFDFADAFDIASRAGAAIVPAALVGNEESYPFFGQVGPLPLFAQFPLAGLGGLLPLPLKWKLRLGDPIAAESLGAGVSDVVRVRIQELIGELLKTRRSVIFG